MGVRATALAWGVGVGLGAALGIGLGPHVPRWGMSMAFPAASLLLALGALKEEDGEVMRHVLRLACGITMGFLAVHVPLTSLGLLQLIEATPPSAEAVSRVTRIQAALTPRWTIITLALPPAAISLWLRIRRDHDLARRRGESTRR